MDTVTAQKLVRFISTDRFATYLVPTGQQPVPALDLYAWNIAIGSAFFGPLQTLEVTLRNAIHESLTARFCQADWWHSSSLVLAPAQQRALGDARTQVLRAGRKPVPHRIVPELPLGFWVGLLGAGVNYEMTLWRPTLRHIFHSYRGTRKTLHRDLDRLRTLRNRIAHHEPIFHRHLSADHSDIIQLIELICPVTADWVKVNSRVPQVLAARPVPGGVRRPSFF